MVPVDRRLGPTRRPGTPPMQRDYARNLFARLGLAAALVTFGCGDDDGGAEGGDTEADGSGSESGSMTSPSTMSTSATMTTGSGTDGSGTGDDTGTGTSDPDDTGTADDTESGSDTGPGVCEVTPGEWAAASWNDNTVDALALRTALDALTGADGMRGAEEGAGTIVEIGDLDALWTAGSPSLADVASPGFAMINADAFEEFIEVIAAGEQVLTDAGGEWSPGEAGGIWGDTNRGINEGGLEVRQIVDKGAFAGGALFNYAATLTQGEIDEATIDAIAAAWGANEALDPKGDLTDSANYGFQMGFHADIAEALTAAKAFAGDPACGAERDAALVTVFALWEQSMHARLVYYANETIIALQSASTDTEFANALHELSEGIGLVVGFYGYAPPREGPLSGGLTTSDADIESIATALGIALDDLGASTTGELVESLPDAEAAVAAVEAVVMDVYGLTAADIMTYRMPTPG